MPSGPELGVTRFDEPEIQALASAQQEEMRGIYGGEADIGPTRDAWMFEPPDGAFVAARIDGIPVGCGGVCRFDDSRAELKRMYVAPTSRGLGLGRRILEALEVEARRLGYVAVVLETGNLQQEALALYTSSGYRPIPCYGVYAEREMSRCFEKQL
jgi:GNAT superfamily N-acetyltransferase